MPTIRGVSTGWHGEEAVRLSAEGLEVVILPDRGGKLASLVDGSGHEWLAQPPAGPLPPVRYGASFVDSEMCGWDEMIPTIDTVGLPDHGEVWAVPWDLVEVTARSVTLEVRGRALPYRIRRTAAVVGPTRLRLSYEATAVGQPVETLWAAHPQFRAPVGTMVELPGHVSHIVDVNEPDRPKLAPWPGGRVDVMRNLTAGYGHKFWCLPDDGPDWCRLHLSGGRSLELRWDPVRIPYLGVWADNCAWSREPVIALEPSTGFYDNLERARRFGRAMRLTPDKCADWQLDITVSPDKEARDGQSPLCQPCVRQDELLKQ